MPFYENFIFDILGPFIHQLSSALSALTTAPLAKEMLAQVPELQGVYQLFWNGEPVYIGKAQTNLRDRLDRHRFKISGRMNVSLAEMEFKCLSVDFGWNAIIHESLPITAFGQNCGWQNSGFGKRSVGRNRDETQLKPEHFDSMFPIRHDWPCEGIPAGSHQCQNLLSALKSELPFLFRYRTTQMDHLPTGATDYRTVMIEVPEAGLQADSLLRLIARNLSGWQATRFPSHMILYPEHKLYPNTHHTIWPV